MAGFCLAVFGSGHAQPILLWMAAALVSLSAQAQPPPPAVSDTITVGPGVFRRYAVHVELPRYPSSSLAARRTGRAVIEVVVSKSGGVASVHILESPDAAIGSAVESAVRRWTFHPFVGFDEKHYRARSRLIFYFKLSHGRPLVIDATASSTAGGHAVH
jgi:TonB family protein